MFTSTVRAPYEQKLRPIDVVIIVSMWSLKFLDTWLRTLFEHTARVVYGTYVDSVIFTRQSVAILFVKCALALATAVVVDSYDHKYWVAIGGMALYVMTPVMALCMCIAEKMGFLVSTLLASSTLFVTSPAAFGLVFNQKKFPIRAQIRRLVSIMEFVEGLLLVLMGLTIPEEAHPKERYALIAGWVLVLPFSIFVLTIIERIRKYVTRDTLPEKGFAAVFKGLKHEITNASERGLTKNSVLFFMLLLLPAFSLTAMGAIVTNLQPKGDTQYQHPLLKQIVVFSELTIIPLTEVVVSFAPVSDALAEMLVLGVAHVLNIVVLSMLVVRTHIKRQETLLSTTTQQLIQPVQFSPPVDRQSNVLVDPPGEKSFVFVLVTALDIIFEFEDDPNGTLFDEYPFVVGYNISLFNRRMTSSAQTVTITCHTPPVTVSRTILFEENKIYVISVIGAPHNRHIIVTGNDVEIPDVIELPIVVVQNTFIGATFHQKPLLEDHELQVTSSTGNAIFNDVLPHRNKTLWFTSRPGRVKFELRYIGNDPEFKRLLKPYPRRFYVVPNALHVVIMTFSVIVYRYAIPVFVKRPLLTTRNPFVIERPDNVLQSSFALLGFTLGLTSVGYISFFWMGCPRRLRATLFAWFIVSNEILGWMAVRIIGQELGPREGIILLAIGTLTAAWHFVLGWYYEIKIMPNILKRRGSTPFDDL